MVKSEHLSWFPPSWLQSFSLQEDIYWALAQFGFYNDFPVGIWWTRRPTRRIRSRFANICARCKWFSRTRCRRLSRRPGAYRTWRCRPCSISPAFYGHTTICPRFGRGRGLRSCPNLTFQPRWSHNWTPTSPNISLINQGLLMQWYNNKRKITIDNLMIFFSSWNFFLEYFCQFARLENLCLNTRNKTD